jgi:hypothetical protein
MTRKQHRDRVITVAWRNRATWSKVHYVGDIGTELMEIAGGRQVMVFRKRTICGHEISPSDDPRYGEYIEGRAVGKCRKCKQLEAEQWR